MGTADDACEALGTQNDFVHHHPQIIRMHTLHRCHSTPKIMYASSHAHILVYVCVYECTCVFGIIVQSKPEHKHNFVVYPVRHGHVTLLVCWDTGY